MKYLKLEVQSKERVGVLTLGYQRENRFHPDFVAELMQVLDEVEQDSKVGALVVTGGDPKFFCNGLDLEWMMAHVTDLKAVLGYLRLVNGMFKRFTLYPKPVVAALNGHTFAAGAFLAAHMDFRLMQRERGWVCMPEVDINIPLLPGMIAICQAVMTAPGFRKLYYTGKRATAEEAYSYGFVDEVVDSDQLMARAIAFAAELGAKRTDTFAEMKRRTRADIARILDEVDPDTFAATLAFALPKA